MKRIAYAALATVSGLVLLFSYRTSTGAEIPTANAAAPAASTGASGSASGTGSNSGSESGTGSDTDSSDSASASGSASGSDATGGTTGSSTTTASSGLKDGTFTGDAASTRYGPVQVQVQVSGGRIASVDVVDYPNENPRDRQINQQAVPMLISETTSAQSAQIDMISGATYTSRGYQQSLQSALDQATS
ncbi:MAG: FMN-binding protein [Microbacterium sp. 69-10]|nr:FMN-binding protein [Microbacterium sp. 69-10]OJU42285.1 MAG: FMN-binding protein [Microbacterium sp. 69-10]